MDIISRKIEIEGLDLAFRNQAELNKLVKEWNALLKQTGTNSKEYEKVNRVVGALKAEQKSLRDETRKASQEFVASGKSSQGAYKALSNELTIARNRLKDMAAAGDVATKEFRELKDEVNKLDKELKDIDASAGQFQRNVGNYPKVLGRAGNALRGLFSRAGIVAGFALLANGFKNITAEAAQIEPVLRGVNFAFERVAGSASAFDRIRESTRGLVSDLDIRKAIVQFDNFGLDVKQLDTLLEFVAVRATQTGESFDKLFDSLVEGLSKESKLRIDNLGISTQALNAELEKTPDFVQAVANIASTELADAGNILDEAANSAQQFQASYENLLTTIAGSSIFQGLRSDFNEFKKDAADGLSAAIQALDTDVSISFSDLADLTAFDDERRNAALERIKLQDAELKNGKAFNDLLRERSGQNFGRRGRAAAGLDAEETKEAEKAQKELTETVKKAKEPIDKLAEAYKELSAGTAGVRDIQTIITSLNKDISETNDQNVIRDKIEEIVSLEARLKSLKDTAAEIRNEIEGGSRGVGDVATIGSNNSLSTLSSDNTDSFNDLQDESQRRIQELANRGNSEAQLRIDLDKKANEAIIENRKKAAEEEIEVEKEKSEALKLIQDAAINAIGSAFNAIFDNQKAKLEQQTDAALESIDVESEARLDAAEGNAALQAQILEEQEAKKKEIEKQAAKERKSIALKEAAIAIALSIIKALPNLAAAAAAAIAGGVQLAIINSTQFKRGGMLYARGGLIVGPPHERGGVKGYVRSTGRPFEAEGGEAFINKRTMSSKDRMTITGTPSQIASKLNSYKGYGDPFASGGSLSKFMAGGILNPSNPNISTSQLSRSEIANAQLIAKAVKLAMEDSAPKIASEVGGAVIDAAPTIAKQTGDSVKDAIVTSNRENISERRRLQDANI